MNIDEFKKIMNEVREEKSISSDDIHSVITQEMVDRLKSGESSINVINELAREYSSYFNYTYESFSFAADALDKRAWSMGLLDKQRNSQEYSKINENFQQNEQFTEDISITINEEHTDDASELLMEYSVPFAIDSEQDNIFYFMENDIEKAKEILNSNGIKYIENN